MLYAEFGIKWCIACPEGIFSEGLMYEKKFRSTGDAV